MPILDKDKVKVYRPGDAVTATVINEDAKKGSLIAVGTSLDFSLRASRGLH